MKTPNSGDRTMEYYLDTALLYLLNQLTYLACPAGNASLFVSQSTSQSEAISCDVRTGQRKRAKYYLWEKHVQNVKV